MLRNQLLNNSRLIARRSVRYNSTASQASSAVSKASSAVSTITSKAAGFVNCSIYWAKVVAELGKHIYVKEGLSPPSGTQFQSVYKNLWQQILTQSKHFANSPAQLVDTVTGVSRQQVVAGGAYLVQFAGLFALGEIIGRRNVFGYPHHHVEEEAEHAAEH
ncbi:F1F0 ATP synthase subunit g [Sugiyamaella lignohabitans]|uniref:F1F0 ATP synthase subunit g n=1 Tax=Sugiyamaella lignohabitans TaxID=796027 RepID=A0A167E9J9_9ASCO|nr:F1F0 ATP synthase subunit g [Sugiyamaella lignohabitans]ANB13808.1 F1F0 ATP synthase subunit g [Sugiyamaella lignohabitans]